MDHLIWLVFDAVIGVWNVSMALTSYRKGKKAWFVLQVLCALAMAAAAWFQFKLMLKG